MLASISETLLAKGLSIETVTTDLQRHVSGSGEHHVSSSPKLPGRRTRRDFVIEADCVATQHLDKEHVESLVEELTHLKTELALDNVDVRVQRLSKRMQEKRRQKSQRF